LAEADPQWDKIRIRITKTVRIVAVYTEKSQSPPSQLPEFWGIEVGYVDDQRSP
jgi:hypothetical protein